MYSCSYNLNVKDFAWFQALADPSERFEFRCRLGRARCRGSRSCRERAAAGALAAACRIRTKFTFGQTRSGAWRIVTSDVLTDVDDFRLSTAFGRFSFEERRRAVSPMSADSAIFLKMDDDPPAPPSLSEWQRSLQRLAAWMTRGNRVREQSRPATPIRVEQSGRSSDAPRRPIPPRP